MHWLTVRALVILAAMASVAVGALAAVPVPSSCDPFTGVCKVSAGVPPSAGHTGSEKSWPPESTGCIGVDHKPYPCYDPRFGFWSGRCYWKLADPQPVASRTLGRQRGSGAFYFYICPPFSAGGAGGEGYMWRRTVPGVPTVTPGELAQRALATVRLPHPGGAMSPDGRLNGGRRYTVVQVPTWFWTNSSSYRPKTATASVGPVWARVTVKPTALAFRPGDGHAVVSCAGPGTPWVAGRDGQWERQPQGCDYVYRQSSIDEPGETVTATYSIEWSVSWTGSDGAAGTLPAMTTSTSSRFAVVEAQAVVVSG